MNEKDYQIFTSQLPGRPGIIGEHQFTKAVVFVPFLFMEGEYHLVFEKRSPHISQAGEVCFPGGLFEPDIDFDAKATALRETEEELGIRQQDILIDGRMDSLLAGLGLLIDIFTGRLTGQAWRSLALNEAEVEKVFTVPVRWFRENPPEGYKIRVLSEPHFHDEKGRQITLLPAKELGLPEKYWQAWPMRKRNIIVYKHEEEIIWGITARIVQEVLRKFPDPPKG